MIIDTIFGKFQDSEAFHKNKIVNERDNIIKDKNFQTLGKQKALLKLKSIPIELWSI